MKPVQWEPSKRFGSLTVIDPFVRKYREDGSPMRNPHALCRCDCGRTQKVDRNDLTRGRTTKCVICSRSTHGLNNTYFQQIWKGMKQRCHNPKHKSFPQYGGKGVQCLFDSPHELVDALGERPSPRHTVDRYPNRNGNYEKGNVRWATKEEQEDNKDCTLLLTYQGQTQSIARWAEQYGLTYNCLYMRVKAGWTTERALKQPPRRLTTITPPSRGLQP